MKHQNRRKSAPRSTTRHSPSTIKSSHFIWPSFTDRSRTTENRQSQIWKHVTVPKSKAKCRQWNPFSMQHDEYFSFCHRRMETNLFFGEYSGDNAFAGISRDISGR